MQRVTFIRVVMLNTAPLFKIHLRHFGARQGAKLNLSIRGQIDQWPDARTESHTH
jgi:hypothetical protein